MTPNSCEELTTIVIIQPEVIDPWESEERSRIKSLVSHGGVCNNFRIVDDTDDAELIVLLESAHYPNKTLADVDYYDRYLGSEYYDHRKLVVINYEDSPTGILPGLYTSLSRSRFDNALHLSWPHMRIPNELVEKQEREKKHEDTFLFSFSGSCSHPMRRRLFDKYGARVGECRVREVDKWYNHDLCEKESYIDEIKRSLFVLCPRGYAPYSHRIIETMALGRVPVIIADDWVPFSVQESGYYVQIKEADIGRIDEVLRKHVASYEALQTCVKFVYGTYFAPEKRYATALNRLVSFSTMSQHHLNRAFLKKRLYNERKRDGLLFRQQIARKIKDRLLRVACNAALRRS
ncbi:MAG: exostosin family protein [Bryobacteraceae bacterium]|nr:exostosin family protein [Bryobacteraceae bacterium]